MISVNRIKFANHSSQDFDLLCDLSFNSDDGPTSTFLAREAVSSETYRGNVKRTYNYKWSESFAPTITFIKNDYGDFTAEEQRDILRWLTSKDTASFLTVYHDDSEVISYEILGNFTSIETYKLGNGRVVGFVAVFESISSWAFSELKTITKTISGADNQITINIKTDDLQEPVYPKIKIKMGSSANDVRILAISADRAPIESKIQNNIANEEIVLDGANKVVYSSRNLPRIFGDNFNWIWAPLFDGINTIVVLGNCQIEISYREPIKLGEF